MSLRRRNPMPHPAIERQIKREEERYPRDIYEPEDPPCAGCGGPTEILHARFCFECQGKGADDA